MKRKGITVLGLGPGKAELLTREAWQIIESAPEIVLRTRLHPALEGFPGLAKLSSFDELYEKSESFEEVYSKIVDRILELGSRPEGIVYAVPGSPFVAEATTPEIARKAHEAEIPFHVVEGLSFLEPTFSLLGVDPLPQMTLVDALELAAVQVPLFPPDQPALIAQIYKPAIASEVKLTLTSVYPDEHPVSLVHAAGTDKASVENVALYQIDQSQEIGLQTCLYLPPLAPGTSFEAFQELIAHLRAPDGCPWDKEQTHKSLRPFLLEETYEVLAALDAENPQEMSEEFGDLLLQVVLHAQIASEDGEFTMSDIMRKIYAKIIFRHPHVFGKEKVGGVEHVLQNWERLKAEEREAQGKLEQSLFEGISPALPALAQAEQYQKRAARVGFDWQEVEGVIEKVFEELEEVRSAENEEQRPHEIGDLLFSAVNLARWYRLDPESALREANTRFLKRFGHIEQAARQQGKKLSDLSLDEMEEHWGAAKKEG